MSNSNVTLKDALLKGGQAGDGADAVGTGEGRAGGAGIFANNTGSGADDGH